MINARQAKFHTVAIGWMAALGMGATFLAIFPGCTTPATPDTAGTGGQGQNGAGSGGATSTGSGGATSSGGTTGSGGATSSGGVTGSGSGGLAASGGTIGAASGGASARGGSSGTTTGGSNGSGDAAGTGGAASGNGSAGANGSGGKAAGSGGATAAVGCNWIDDAVAKTSKFATPAPADKIVLFDGTTKDGWHTLPDAKGATKPIDWVLDTTAGTLTVKPNSTMMAVIVQSAMAFEDLCVHVEYLTPDPSTYRNGGTDLQTHGNSGVYLKGAYEMQILDTFGMAVADDRCGAIYKLNAPLASACLQHGNWNTYEIEFKSSVWNGTAKTKPAQYIKVALNGTVVQQNFVLTPAAGYTQAGIPDAPGPQPLGLQDHLDPVKFRNIWVTVPKY